MFNGTYSNGFYGISNLGALGLGAGAFCSGAGVVVAVSFYFVYFGCAFSEGLYPSTSCFKILPSGPEPFPISLRFIPF